MPKQKTGKPAAAGPKPMPPALPQRSGFDPSSLKARQGPYGTRLVAKRGLIPGKSGQR